MDSRYLHLGVAVHLEFGLDVPRPDFEVQAQFVEGDAARLNQQGVLDGGRVALFLPDGMTNAPDQLQGRLGPFGGDGLLQGKQLVVNRNGFAARALGL